MSSQQHYKLVSGGVYPRRVTTGPGPEDYVSVPQRGFYKRVPNGVKFCCPICGVVGLIGSAQISPAGEIASFTCPEGHTGSATLVESPATKGPDQVAIPAAAVASTGAK